MAFLRQVNGIAELACGDYPSARGVPFLSALLALNEDHDCCSFAI
jgi:hypothetical protein